MDIEYVKSVINDGESDIVEFKTSTAQLKAVFETVCAFLNSNKNGVVFIGVNDKGNLVGQNVTDNTRQEIARELNKIEPHADIDVAYISLENDRYVIALSTKPGVLAPYVYDGRSFLRNQSTTIRMPMERYEQILYEKRSKMHAWEKLAINDCDIGDLDKNRIQQVVRIAIAERRLTETAVRSNTKEILKKFNLMVDEKLTNAAVVLFCKNQHRQFIQSKLRLARFRGINKNEFIDNKAICGNAFDLYEHAMNFLRSYLPIAGKIEEGNPFREDTPAIPYKVLREALVNALCHRDYSLPGGSISLAVYDDRVEVSSTGRLPNNISLRDLMRHHESHPRNPLIANVFFTCGMVERWGRGTQDMIEFCRVSGNPKPKFVELTGSFTVVLPLKESIGGAAKQLEQVGITARQEEILKVLEKSPCNSIQLLAKLKNSSSIRIVQIDLSKLEKMGLVKREGKARALVWKLRKDE